MRPTTFQLPLRTRQILLTGATGVLGGHLLKETLEKTDSVIHCLVRGDNAAHARTRLLRSLSTYDPEGRLSDAFRERARIHTGDVTQPRLGLAPRDYEELAVELALVTPE